MIVKAVLVSAGYLLFLAIQVLPLVRARRWRDFAACGLLLLASWAIALVMALNLPVPTPTELMARLFGDFAAKLMLSP